ncbi:hypothetical protein MPDQ_006056 [Monascus purpureus]|uniref:Cyclin-domain-containing protein n=1 Tax=Monascus purpureus TaxID=5098 RepID=A0A507QZL3_MONPU|nr:hypothetical protein MPDQ_006056 [Monascus purpureus]
MLGGAINQATTPSEAIYRHPSSRPTSQLEARPSSSNNAPISATAPRATAHLSSHPPHGVPTYSSTSQSRSLTHRQPDTRASSTAPASAYADPSISMTSSTSVSHAPPSTYPVSDETADPSRHAYSVSQATKAMDAMSYDGGQLSPSSPQLQPTFRSFRSLGNSEATSPSRIKVRDLSHIQSFASEEFLAQTHQNQVSGQWLQERQYEISSMPVTDVIEMVASLLTKITATNDMYHDHIHRHIPPPDGTASLSPQATSVLAFHGKNVPSITILSYLSRIHKYCPTTYEVFLSLLVYFDRMTETVNRGRVEQLRRRWSLSSSQHDVSPRPAPADPSSTRHPSASPMATPPSSAGLAAQDGKSPASSASSSLYSQGDAESLSHFFVVDSFNIHRLIIAGVTCASKFFSDVFYTNSRYAKVGGLPQVELNHLELQFLILNDFRLAISVEELEVYGTMLVEFYAREIVAQRQHQLQQMAVPESINPKPEDIYTRSRDKRRTSHAEVHQTPTPP